jgi:hypothetical protein
MAQIANQTAAALQREHNPAVSKTALMCVLTKRRNPNLSPRASLFSSSGKEWRLLSVAKTCALVVRRCIAGLRGVSLCVGQDCFAWARPDRHVCSCVLHYSRKGAEARKAAYTACYDECLASKYHPKMLSAVIKEGASRSCAPSPPPHESGAASRWQLQVSWSTAGCRGGSCRCPGAQPGVEVAAAGVLEHSRVSRWQLQVSWSIAGCRHAAWQAQHPPTNSAVPAAASLPNRPAAPPSQSAVRWTRGLPLQLGMPLQRETTAPSELPLVRFTPSTQDRGRSQYDHRTHACGA